MFWVNAIGLPADFAAPAPDEPHAASITLAAAAGAYTVLLHPGLTNFPTGAVNRPLNFVQVSGWTPM